jgi:hypothetical protein
MEVLVRTVCAGVLTLVLATSQIFAAPAAAGQSEPPTPARDHRLAFAVIGGSVGGVAGAIGWHMSGAHTDRRDNAGRAAAVGVILGAGIGVFIASFSLPPSDAVSHASAATKGIAIRSNLAVQPLIARGGGAAIVRLRF